jgi:hypothetical protein
LAIHHDRPCDVGQYAGNHSRTTDSQCLPCAMNDTLYEGHCLRFYTSAGRRYDDLTSCDIACRPFSRLRDIANRQGRGQERRRERRRKCDCLSYCAVQQHACERP